MVVSLGQTEGFENVVSFQDMEISQKSIDLFSFGSTGGLIPQGGFNSITPPLNFLTIFLDFCQIFEMA